MPCGYENLVWEKRWHICYWDLPYPCGVEWCTVSVPYPCGVKWCKKWGVKYPCGIKWCTASATVPCGLKICRVEVPYPCYSLIQVKKVCYDYTSIGKHCKLFHETVYVCCEGKEYKYTKACLGWYDWYYGVGRVCIDEPAKKVSETCRADYSVPFSGQVPEIPRTVSDYLVRGVVIGGISLGVARLVLYLLEFLGLIKLL